MPTNGAFRLRSISTHSAFSGEIYNTRDRGFVCAGWVISRSIADRNAASVLPEPVGAITSACWPEAIVCHAPSCALVGWANAASNHAEVAAENPSSTELMPPDYW